MGKSEFGETEYIMMELMARCSQWPLDVSIHDATSQTNHHRDT